MLRRQTADNRPRNAAEHQEKPNLRWTAWTVALVSLCSALQAFTTIYFLAITATSLLFFTATAQAVDVTDEPFVGIDIGPLTQQLRSRFNVTMTATGAKFRNPRTTASAVLTNVHANSQAAAAGLEPGDIVLSVGIIIGPENRIIQWSYPANGPTSNFEDPTSDEVRDLIQHGLNVGAWSFNLFVYRPSSSDRTLSFWLAYPKGYRIQTTERASHKNWLEERQQSRTIDKKADRNAAAEGNTSQSVMPTSTVPVEAIAPAVEAHFSATDFFRRSAPETTSWAIFLFCLYAAIKETVRANAAARYKFFVAFGLAGLEWAIFSMTAINPGEPKIADLISINVPLVGVAIGFGFFLKHADV
jgi:hypothetical protein